MNWKKKFMWAASFLVSLFVCGTALAAGNDASADTPAQGKEENQVYRFGTENNANDITETEASAAESGAAGLENKEMYLYEGEWVGDGRGLAVPPDGWQLFESVLAEIEWSLVLSGKKQLYAAGTPENRHKPLLFRRERRDDDWLDL